MKCFFNLDDDVRNYVAFYTIIFYIIENLMHPILIYVGLCPMILL